MKIDNGTAYRTDDLKRLIAAALERDGIGTRGFTVSVRTTKQSVGCSGYAWYHKRSMVLRLPEGRFGMDGRRSSFLVLPKALRDDFARVAMHEAAHCRGVTHDEMSPALRRGTPEIDVAWAAEFEIRRTRTKSKPKPKPTPTDRLAISITKAEAMLRRAMTRLQRAATIEKKWRLRVTALVFRRRSAAESPSEGRTG